MRLPVLRSHPATRPLFPPRPAIGEYDFPISAEGQRLDETFGEGKNAKQAESFGMVEKNLLLSGDRNDR